ncbi:MAG: hypothetical protein QW594_00455 [Candidatus Woesearchaeota archaeon]
MAKIHPLAWLIIGLAIGGLSWWMTFFQKIANFELFMVVGSIMAGYGGVLTIIHGVKANTEEKKGHAFSPYVKQSQASEPMVARYSNSVKQSHSHAKQASNALPPPVIPKNQDVQAILVAYIMPCPYCKARTPKNGLYCAFCGRKLR